MVESLVLLLASGGECGADIERLRQDPGLSQLTGHPFPSSETTLKFLKAFHDDSLMAAAREQRKPGQLAFIPTESHPLQGLAQVQTDMLKALEPILPVQRVATVDQDATIVESRNRNAQWTYQGMPGYQPMVAMCAESELVLADEFRDGNVPATMQPLSVCKRAFAALPKTVTTYYYRADSASYEHEILTWLCDENRSDGPQGFIGFGISARMTAPLHLAVLSVPDSDWHPFHIPGTPIDMERDVADIPFIPPESSVYSSLPPLRFIGIRIRPRQGELFPDGHLVRHFVLVSNLWKWDASRLVDWHRQKAGTIEKLHDVVKNELGGGVMPSHRFGNNAAWFRLSLLTHNILVALKRLALPPELADARPKKLRFEILWQAARVTHHARCFVLRLSTKVRAVIDRFVQGYRALCNIPLAVPSRPS